MDFARAFSAQKRTTPALVSSVAALETLLAQEAAADASATTSRQDAKRRRPASSRIDALLLSHPFTDHAHPETLLDPSLPPHISLYVTSDAKAALPKELVPTKRPSPSSEVSWTARRRASQSVYELDEADVANAPSLVSQGETKQEEGSVLPSNIAILQTHPHTRLPAFLGGPAALASQKLHGGVVILWREAAVAATADAAQPPPPPTSDAVHAIVYSPHGAAPSSIPRWLGEAPVAPCALLTSLDRIVLPRWLSGTVNLGLPGALALLLPGSHATATNRGEEGARTAAAPFAARHLVDTHGEHKAKQGLVASLMHRYYLGDEHDEIGGVGAEKSVAALKEARRSEAAQRLVNEAAAAAAPESCPAAQALAASSVHCLGVGGHLQLP